MTARTRPRAAVPRRDARPGPEAPPAARALEFPMSGLGGSAGAPRATVPIPANALL